MYLKQNEQNSKQNKDFYVEHFNIFNLNYLTF